MNTVSLFHYLLTLIIWCNKLLFLFILDSLFTDSLNFLSVFTHGFIQLFFNVMNRIKIINQVWLELWKHLIPVLHNFPVWSLRHTSHAGLQPLWNVGKQMAFMLRFSLSSANKYWKHHVVVVLKTVQTM